MAEGLGVAVPWTPATPGMERDETEGPKARA